MTETLKNKVYKILRDYPKSRNSDLHLTAIFWQLYFPSRIRKDDNGKKYLYLSDYVCLTKQSDISRVRQIIQNIDGEFLPDSPEVRKQRNINEEKWKEFILKNNNKNI